MSVIKTPYKKYDLISLKLLNPTCCLSNLLWAMEKLPPSWVGPVKHEGRWYGDRWSKQKEKAPHQQGY